MNANSESDTLTPKKRLKELRQVFRLNTMIDCDSFKL